MADLDRLQIQIEASAAEAMPALDDVINKLTDLNNALRGVGNAGKSFQKSMTGLSNTSITLGRSVGSGFGKALTKGIEGSIQNAFKGVGSIIKNISKMAVIGIPSLGIKGFQLVGSGFKLVGKGALAAASGIKSFASFVQGAKNESKSLTSILGGLYLRLWGLKKVGSIIGTIASKAMNFVESYHYFEMAFQKIGEDAADNWAEAGYESAEAYADSFRTRALELTEKMSGFAIDAQGNATATGNKSLGLDPEMLVNYQAMYGQMANGLGLVSSSAENASKALTMLGADWSSLRNIDFSTSYEKLASALAGQSRAVRSLGIDITQATLQQYAYAAGVNTSVSEMDQAAKTQLRLIAILDQSRVAWGDMAKTLNTPANQFRLLQQNVASLARTIGSILLPILKIVLPYINAVVIALQRLFAWLAKLLNADTEEVTTAIGGMNDAFADMGDDMNGIDTSGIDAVADSANDATDAIGDTVDELEEAKRTILGFDELNVLNAPVKDTASATPTGGGGLTPTSGGGVGGFNPGDMGLLDDYLGSLLSEYETKWNEAFNSMANKAQQIADAIVDAFKKKDWYGLGSLMASGVEWALGKIYEFLDPNTIYPKIKKVTDAVTTVINGFVQNFPADLFGRTLGRMLNTYVFTMNQLYDGIDWPSIGQKLATAFLGLLDEVDPYELGRLLTQKFRAAVSILVGFFSEMQGHWDEVGRKLGTMISGALSNIHPEDIAFVLSNAINAGIHILAGLIETFPWDEVSDKITTGINDMIAWIEWDNLGATLGLALMKITTTITRILTGIHWEDLGRGMGAGLLRFVNAIDTNAPGELLAAGIKGILTFLYSGINEFRTGGGFKKLAEMAAGCIKAVFANQEIWNELGLLLKEMLRSAIDFLLVLDENIPWADIGTQIHDFIFGIIDDDELWNDAFKALHDWLVDICTFINAALPQGPDEWEKIGKRIAQFLEDIPWGTLFDTVVSNLADAIVGLWRGLGSSFVGRCVRAIVAVGITWTVFSPLISAIGRIFVMDKFTTSLATKIASSLGTGLNTGATTAAGRVAANGGLKLFSGSIASVLGSAALIVGVADAFLNACRTIGLGIEILQGGNGMDSDEGVAVNGLIKSLRELNKLTPQQATEIWNLKETMETSGASAEEVTSAVMGKLAEYNVSLDSVEVALGNMEQKGYATDGMLNTLKDSTSGLKTETDIAASGIRDLNSALDLSAYNDGTTWSYEDIADSVANLAGKGAIATEQWHSLDSAMLAQNGTITSLQGWYDALIAKCQELNIPIDAVTEEFGIDFPLAVSTGMGSAATSAEGAKTSITQSTDEIRKKAESDASSLVESWSSGSVQLKDDTEQNFSAAKKAAEAATGDIATSTDTDAKAASKSAQEESKKVATDTEKNFGDAKTKAENETSLLKSAVVKSFGDLSFEIGQKMTSLSLDLHGRFTTLATSLPKHFQNIGTDVGTHFGSIVTEAEHLMIGVNRMINLGLSDVRTSFNQMYNIGRDAIIELQRGLYSIHIFLPHIYKGGDDTYYYGDGAWFDIPWFAVNWYAKGGLATAPTLAGIGEAGQEAVLPLTNKRAMANIADAIVSGGGLGMSHDDMVEAVATGVAMAMAQNPQTVELVVNSVLKTDDEKLAQSVSRGRAKLDQRFNVASAY